MDLYINLSTAFIVSAVFSWLLFPAIQRICIKKKLFDSHDERKTHTGIIPRLGGVVFLPVLSFTFLLILSINILLQTPFALSVNRALHAELMLALAGVLLLYFTGVGDDLVSVSCRTKLIVQVIAGILFASSGIWINNLHGIFGLYEINAVVGIPLTIFVIVFIINAINFIDGIDGLAAGISMFAFFCYGLIFLYMGSNIYSMLAFGSLGMLIPFFYYNVFGKTSRGNKIFMGDSGSLTIGMLLSVFAVKVCNYDPNGVYQSPQLILFAFSVLIVPMFDAPRVVLFRICSGKSPFKPDKNHLHHHFLQLGFSHKTTMLMILAVAVFFGAGSILLTPYMDVELILGWIVLLWIMMEVFLRMKMKQASRQSVPAKSNKAI